jgi:hypothetical protein
MREPSMNVEPPAYEQRNEGDYYRKQNYTSSLHSVSWVTPEPRRFIAVLIGHTMVTTNYLLSNADYLRLEAEKET